VQVNHSNAAPIDERETDTASTVICVITRSVAATVREDMAKTAPRTYPAHQGFHWRIAESFIRESKIRIGAYKVKT